MLARAARALSFPANFTLIAAMNPCPCGYFGDPRRACSCAPRTIGWQNRFDGRPQARGGGETGLVPKQVQGAQPIPGFGEALQRILQGRRELAIGNMTVGDERIIGGWHSSSRTAERDSFVVQR